MQEKANDRQAELDVLRAKRAMEQNERNARKKEQMEAEHRVIFCIYIFKRPKLIKNCWMREDSNNMRKNNVYKNKQRLKGMSSKES